MNKVQIAGIITLVLGVAVYFVYKDEESNLIAGLLIGLGAGLTVYKKKNNSNKEA